MNMSERLPSKVASDILDVPWWESNSPAEVSSCSEASESVLANLPGRNKRLAEEADDYPHVIAQLNSCWRVILCRDGIQWILQRWTGGRWRSESYCRTREGLLKCIREKGIDEEATAPLMHLPRIVQDGGCYE